MKLYPYTPHYGAPDAPDGPDTVRLRAQVTEHLNHTRGPIVEFAGPTPHGYALVDPAALRKPVTVSSLFTGLPHWSDEPEPGCRPTNADDARIATAFGWGRPPSYVLGAVDLQADVTRMPFATGSVGAVLVSCLQHEARPRAIAEAARVLEDKGALVWQGAAEADARTARLAGLTLCVYGGTMVFAKASKIEGPLADANRRANSSGLHCALAFSKLREAAKHDDRRVKSALRWSAGYSLLEAGRCAALKLAGYVR